MVLGSRLDSRLRSSNSANFAPRAKKLVIDVDNEELRKYHNDGYTLINNNIKNCVKHIQNMHIPKKNNYIC